jgi:nitrogen-specific signal transduction histidine kinase
VRGAAFIVCSTIVSTTIYGIGYFGDPSFSFTDRVLEARASILFVALSANILAALFAERRDSETHLARSNMMLERERGNRLMNIDAVTASIAHEMKQPLTAIAANGGGALALLGKSPPDINEACAALNDIVDDSHRANNALDGIRSLFKQVDPSWHSVDMNQIARDVLQSIRGELNEHGILARPEMAYDLPLVEGNASQLHQALTSRPVSSIPARATPKRSGRRSSLNIRSFNCSRTRRARRCRGCVTSERSRIVAATMRTIPTASSWDRSVSLLRLLRPMAARSCCPARSSRPMGRSFRSRPKP